MTRQPDMLRRGPVGCTPHAPHAALASASRRHRPGSSTSAGPAPRSTTGRSPSGSGGTFVLRIEDTDEARNQPEWTQGIIDALAWIGIAADDPHFEGPYFQSSYADEHVAAAQRLFEAGDGVLLRPHRRADPGARQGQRQAGLRRLLPRPRPRARARSGAALPCARRRDVVHDSSAARSSSTNDDHRGLRAAARQRHADVPARQRGRRHRDADQPRRARRGAPAEHAEAADAVGGARQRAAGRGPTCPCSSTSSARSCPSGATRWPSSSTAPRATSPTAMVNYLMTLGWAPGGDTEIVPWSTIERDVPPGGRQPLAGVLRPQEAHGVQRRVHPRAARRRVHRRLPAVAHRADVPWPRGAIQRRRVRGDRAARADARGHARRGRRRWSTSCSSPTPSRRRRVREGDGDARRQRGAARDRRGVRDVRSGTPTR